jgi:hypothetical protein
VTPLIKPFKLSINANDVFFLVGAAVAIAGGVMISLRWTLVAAGGALVVLSLVGLGSKS